MHVIESVDMKRKYNIAGSPNPVSTYDFVEQHFGPRGSTRWQFQFNGRNNDLIFASKSDLAKWNLLNP